MPDYNNRDNRRNNNPRYNNQQTYNPGGGRYNPPDMRDLTGYKSTLTEKGYYTDQAKQKLNPDFIVTYAKDVAHNIDEEGKGTKNKRTQVRKYYDYLIRVNQKLERCNMDYTYIAADVSELAPMVNYAQSRSVVSAVFVSFIEDNLRCIRDDKDFTAFLKHFEAIVAYMKKDTK